MSTFLCKNGVRKEYFLTPTFIIEPLFAAVFFYLGYMLVNPNLYNNKEYMNYCNKM